MSIMFLFIAIIVSITTVVVYAQHNCQQYGCSQSNEVANSGSNYLELYSQTPSGATFNFDVNLNGNAEFTCLDVGVCTTNSGGESTLYISYQSTNTYRWTADLALAFYGTGQTFGGCQCRGPLCQCGNTIVGSHPNEYRQFVNGNVQVNSNFNPLLASGFTAVCIVNTCSGGFCPESNRFYGSFVISHLSCTAAPVTMGHPLIVPIQAPTAPSINPTKKPTKVPSTIVPTLQSTITPTEPSVEPTMNPSSEPTCRPTGPSNGPSTAPSNPTYDPTIDEMIGERK